MSRSFIPDTDGGFLDFAENFNDLIGQTPTAFGLTAEDSDGYNVLFLAYDAALSVATAPPTKTRVTVAQKNLARDLLKDLTRLLAARVQCTPTVSDAQKLALGLTVRKSPTPVPIPSSAPDIDFIEVDGRRVKIRMHDAASGTKRKPAQVKGGTLFSYVGATPPGDLSAWKFELSTNQPVVDIQFADTVPPGSQIWLTAFWFNNRSVNGPACNPVTTNIAGGGISMAA